MKTTSRSRMAAVVVAALLMSALVGVVWARSNEGPGVAEITRKVTLAGSDFIPGRDGTDWQNSGYLIKCISSQCEFYAPVVFPCLPSVTIERIKLHVEDKNATDTAEATLLRAVPSKGTVKYLGEAESPEGTSGGFQTYDSGPINKVVWPSQKAYVYLYMYPDVDVFGVTIEYHRNV